MSYLAKAYRNGKLVSAEFSSVEEWEQAMSNDVLVACSILLSDNKIVSCYTMKDLWNNTPMVMSNGVVYISSSGETNIDFNSDDGSTDSGNDSG